MLLTELYPKVSAIIYNVTVIIKTLVLFFLFFYLTTQITAFVSVALMSALNTPS